MPGAKWYSQPDRPDKRVLGAFDPTAIADDDVRAALERIREDLRFLQRTCPEGFPVYGLKADCWNPRLTRRIYGNHNAHFNTTVLSYRLQSNRTIWLPDAVYRPGGYVEIIDAEGNAATTNITVKTLKGQTINGATTYTISTSKACVAFRSTGEHWVALATSAGGTGSATDHGGLGGLTDDDHTQYAKDSGTPSSATKMPVYTADRTIAPSGIIIADGAGGVNLTAVGTIGSGAITSTGFIKSSSAADGIGYATGAGGSATQATSKSTGVTLDTICGRVTMHAAALAAGASVSFVLTNSTVGANDGLLITNRSSNNYRFSADTVAAGSVEITLDNISTGSLAEAVAFNFQVIKGVTL